MPLQTSSSMSSSSTTGSASSSATSSTSTGTDDTTTTNLNTTSSLPFSFLITFIAVFILFLCCGLSSRRFAVRYRNRAVDAAFIAAAERARPVLWDTWPRPAQGFEKWGAIYPLSAAYEREGAVTPMVLPSEPPAASTSPHRMSLARRVVRRPPHVSLRTRLMHSFVSFWSNPHSQASPWLTAEPKPMPVKALHVAVLIAMPSPPHLHVHEKRVESEAGESQGEGMGDFAIGTLTVPWEDGGNGDHGV